ARGIADVQERDVHRIADRIRNGVHGVAAQDENAGAAALDLARRIRQLPADLVPSCAHQWLDLAQVDGHHDARRVVIPAETLPGLLVDESIVFGRGFTTHAADHANGLHLSRIYGIRTSIRRSEGF